MYVEIYSKDGCPFCTKAKAFFKKHEISFVEIDLNDDIKRKEFYARTSTKSVPQIYINGEHIGGYDDLFKRRHEFTVVPILREQKAYVMDYPVAVDFADKQWDVFWGPNEIKVEKDVQDIMVNLTDAERHGVVTVLRLFTLYELFAGDEYWGGRVKETFKRPCIRRMASTFSTFELGVHAPFYAKLNDALHLSNEEFYLSYINDPTLKERMDFIDEIVSHKDDLLSLGAFSMVEGAILYSSFAFLKHFQTGGKNKLLNVVRGIDFSVRDENLHAEGGAWLYRTLKAELKHAKQLDKGFKQEKREAELLSMAEKLYEHECRIVDMIFEKGRIQGITDIQMKNFVHSRIRECLKKLDIEELGMFAENKYNPIADWFYKSINEYQMNDFFTGIGNQYNRKWDEGGFEWKTAT